ncbi:MAG: AbrB/MazE/SpoVT family DNA-binding domain-containing protein [Candidatus Kariarchaeaceae archaeon]|jgi:AbrB family looped-hinge helix DNA binding protein
MKVSSKGQVVIPSEYRERLGIEPGTEVVVRIRGQFLLIELDTDIEGDIAFLEQYSGQLEEGTFDMNSCEDIIRDLIEQQFYEGGDIITDRVGNQKITIRGADRIIAESIKILSHASRHWLDGNYVECLREFSEALDLDFPLLLATFRGKLDAMIPGGDLEMVQMMGGEVIFSMVVSTAITHFRERVGDMVTERLIKRAEEKGYIKSLGEDTVVGLVTKQLAERYSILMNLRTLRELARTSVKSVGQRMFTKLGEEMLDEFGMETTPLKVIERRKRTYRRRLAKAREEGKALTDAEKEKLRKELGLDSIIVEESIAEEEEPDEEAMPEIPSFDF